MLTLWAICTRLSILVPSPMTVSRARVHLVEHPWARLTTAGGAPHEQLSEREFQVFLKLAKGETAGDIAKALSLSVKTVSTYRTRLMEKMSLASNSDLTYYALKNKLID
mgnify:CR=1 FL=1